MNDSTIYIGIDPGVSGAVAFLYPGGEVEVNDPPTIAVSTSTGKRRMFIESDMASLLREGILAEGPPRRVFCCIEHAQSMPGQGVVAVFSYGQGFGTWLGILAALGVPFTKVRAAAWKKVMLAGYHKPDKATSALVASEMFPDADLGKKKDAGRAEALLIAAYARRIDRL